MRQLKLGIFGTEQKYVIGLMNYINADKKNPVFAMAFSSEERLKMYLEDHKLDIILADEDVADAAFALVDKTETCRIQLTEQQKKPKDCHTICRYLKAGDILKQMLQIMRAREADGKKELFQTYAVISPIGRSGKTRLAKAVCLMDEVRGGLYIGMEGYGKIIPQDDEMEKNKAYTMSDLAYLIRIRSEDIFDYLDKSIIAADGFGMIVSPESYLDLRELDRQDMDWFIKKLVAYGRYTSIVFDIDGNVLGDIGVLGSLDHIFVPTIEGEYADEKLKTFCRLLEKKELLKVVMQMKKIQVPDGGYDSAEVMQCAGRLVGI